MTSRKDDGRHSGRPSLSSCRIASCCGVTRQSSATHDVVENFHESFAVALRAVRCQFTVLLQLESPAALLRLMDDLGFGSRCVAFVLFVAVRADDQLASGQTVKDRHGYLPSFTCCGSSGVPRHFRNHAFSCSCTKIRRD
jgi:hypothetical protein